MPPKKQPIIEYIYSDPHLPPGNNSKEIFGNLRIIMKQIHLFDNQDTLFYNIKFWGQKGDGIKIKPQNSLGDYQTQEEYHFTVPIMGAHLYLNDMQSLQILLHDSLKIYGYININFARHLQKDLSRNTLFHQISGQYPIYKYSQQKNDNEFKIGYQDIAIESDFISLESQLLICQKLKQQENALHLQQLLNKSRNPPQKIKTPSVVTIFPTQKEQWLEQNANDKLANVLFAKNPFENKPVEEQQYDQSKYQTTNYKENNVNVNNENKVTDLNHEVGQASNIQKSPQITINKENNINYKQRDASTSPLRNNNEHKHEHAIDTSPPKNKFVQEPMRHPKVGAGHYENTPTGQKFVKETSHYQPQPRVKNVTEKPQVIQATQATPKKETHNYYVQTEYLVQTRGIQSDNKQTKNHEVQTESIKAVPITEENIKDQYHTFNPTIYIAITKIQGIDNCTIKYKLPGVQDQFECHSPITDHEMILPFNYGSFLKSQHQPIIFEVHQERFLGLTRIKINQIYETLMVDQSILFNVFHGTYPLLICNEFSPIQTLRNENIGHVQIQIAFGTPKQIYKLQQQSLFLRKQEQQELINQIIKDKENLKEMQKQNTLKQEQMINMQLAVENEKKKFKEQLRHEEELREQQALIALLAEKKPESPKQVQKSDFGVQIDYHPVIDVPIKETTPPKAQVIEQLIEEPINQPTLKCFYIHRFTLKLREVSNLNLQVPIGTEIMISYSFPLCDFVVKSYPLMYSDQRSYAVPSEASYFYIQEQNEPFIDVVDNLDGGILFKLGSYSSCLLSSQELDLWMKKDQFNRDKTLVFNGIGAKLNLSLSYTRELITQEQIDEELLSLHNQTQQQIHLPKRVTLNLDATININEKLLRFQDKTLDVSIQTVMQFKKSIPKLYGQKLVRFNEEASLAISDQILDILKFQPLIVEIKSNDQVLGKCELQQQCLLRDGIDGEYALINDKGIYAGFIKIKLTLERFKLPADIQLTMETIKEVQQYNIPEDYNYSKIRSIINAI